MIRIANQKESEAQGATNVTFRQGTLDGPTPYEPEHFDSAWAYPSSTCPRSAAHPQDHLRPPQAPAACSSRPTSCLRRHLGTLRPRSSRVTALVREGAGRPHLRSGRRSSARCARQGSSRSRREVGGGKMVAFLVAKKPDNAQLAATDPHATSQPWFRSEIGCSRGAAATGDEDARATIAAKSESEPRPESARSRASIVRQALRKAPMSLGDSPIQSTSLQDDFATPRCPSNSCSGQLFTRQVW